MVGENSPVINWILLQMKTLLLSLIILIFAGSIGFRYLFRIHNACDLNGVAQREFIDYYGLIDVENPLSHMNAEQKESMNSRCQLFYDHMHVFSHGILSLSKSMIIKAYRGAGKTQIRQCVISRLNEGNRIVLKLFGALIDHYLNNFVKNIDMIDNPPPEKVREFWTKEYFFQIILTELTSRLVNEKYLDTLRKAIKTIPSEIRYEVATLLSFYSIERSATLCKMVDLLGHELRHCGYFSCSSLCDDIQNGNTETETTIYLREKHAKIKVIRRRPGTEASLKLIQFITRETKIWRPNCLEGPYRDQLTSLIKFSNHLNLGITVVVDSLDESNIFFPKNDNTDLRPLQKFIDSATDDDVLLLALGNWGGDMRPPTGISFFILVPETAEISVNISWVRRDKIPIIDLKWNELQLINYVDYIFDYLRKKSHDQCRKLPDICTLLGGQELCVKTMKQLRHPRDFHIFFRSMMERMGTVSKQRDPPFIATKEDLEMMLKQTNKNVLQEGSQLMSSKEL